jgi:hypothetical protein
MLKVLTEESPDASVAAVDAASREDTKQLFSLASQAALESKSAFPALSMLNVLTEETLSRIDDVHLRWRLDAAACFAVQVDVVLQNGTIGSCMIPSPIWTQRLSMRLDAAPGGTDDVAMKDADDEPRRRLQDLRGVVLQSILGERSRDVASIEGRLFKPPSAPIQDTTMHTDLLHLLQIGVSTASLQATAHFRSESLLQLCLGVFQPERTYGHLMLPAPVCILDPSAHMLVLADTRCICRTFQSATECFSTSISLLCNRTATSEEINVAGGFPAFSTSAQEEFHSLSTLAPVVSQVVRELGCSIGLTYLPPDNVNKKETRRGFVSAPPPPVAYDKFHTVFCSVGDVQPNLMERASKADDGSAPWYVFLRCSNVADVMKIKVPEGVVLVAVLRPLQFLLTKIVDMCATFRREDIPFAFDLSQSECVAACTEDGVESLLPPLSVACGASFVWLPPPRGSQHTALYNAFLRMEEELVERQGFCYATPWQAL